MISNDPMLYSNDNSLAFLSDLWNHISSIIILTVNKIYQTYKILCSIFHLYSFIFTEVTINDGETCPSGYMPEACTCIDVPCPGARFEGDRCVSKSGQVCFRLYLTFITIYWHFSQDP